MSAGNNHSRPLSPFTSIWRWHITMLTSIFHRASGVALGAGSLLLALWLFAVASGEKTYATLTGYLLSWPGKLAVFAFSLALFFHLLNGVRHLVWDTGRGLDAQTARSTSWLVLILALVLTVALWSAGYWMFEAFPGQKTH